MPSLETPVLTVDANTIHCWRWHWLILTAFSQVKNLISIWTLFSWCSGSIKEGRHLENLSRRLWNRETFCCAPGEANATTPEISMSERGSEGRYTTDIPDLSSSIDLIDEEAVVPDNEEGLSISAPLTTTRPRVRRQYSGCNRSRGKERHVTPNDLKRMVITITEKKDLEPLTMSAYSYLAPPPSKTTPSSPHMSPGFQSLPPTRR
jgi:hypothetical protein